MAEVLFCFRCGGSLATLTPPMSRQDMCPACSSYLHVCRMCVNFDEHVVAQCHEEDAEEVLDKEKANFCDWFTPSANAYCPAAKIADEKARSRADALFGGSSPGSMDDDNQAEAAEDLFK